MTRPTGFSLVEVITTVSIVALLTAIAFPVFGAVKRRIRERTSVEHMRQIWAALSVYRQDYDGAPAGGINTDPATLGLPLDPMWLVRSQKLPREILTPGGEAQWAGLKSPVYVWLIPWKWDDLNLAAWNAYVARMGEGSAFIVDDSFNEPYARMHPFRRHHLIGAHLDGHIKSKEGFGDYTNYEFWASDPRED